MEFKTFKPGDIIFFNWKNPGYKIIRFYNRVKYGKWGWAHVGIVTYVQRDKVLIHEAIGTGVTRSWYTIKFLERKIDEGIVDIQRPKQKLLYIEDCANKYYGKGYGWLDIIGIGICFLLGWKGMKITGASKLICSEAVARILYDASNKEINFENEYDKSYDMITPMDIYLSKQI